MNQKPINLTVLGLDIAFRQGADMERVKEVVRFLEERYEAHKAQSRGSQSKDILLTFLALGLADELLQLKSRQTQLEDQLRSLLAQIEKAI